MRWRGCGDNIGKKRRRVARRSSVAYVDFAIDEKRIDVILCGWRELDEGNDDCGTIDCAPLLGSSG